MDSLRAALYAGAQGLRRLRERRSTAQAGGRGTSFPRSRVEARSGRSRAAASRDGRHASPCLRREAPGRRLKRRRARRGP